MSNQLLTSYSGQLVKDTTNLGGGSMFMRDIAHVISDIGETLKLQESSKE